MSEPTTYELQPVGWVDSTLTDRAAAPKQGDEGAPLARIIFRSEIWEAAADLCVGDEVLVLTWLHQGNREPAPPGRLLHALVGSPQPNRAAPRQHRERRGERHRRPQSRSD